MRAWYTDSNLYLYDSRGEEIRTWRGGTALGSGSKYGGSVDTTNVLQSGDSVVALREFLVDSDQHLFKVVYRLPGHGDFAWYIW